MGRISSILFLQVVIKLIIIVMVLIENPYLCRMENVEYKKATQPSEDSGNDRLRRGSNADDVIQRSYC
jgi:hypothetical protein